MGRLGGGGQGGAIALHVEHGSLITSAVLHVFTRANETADAWATAPLFLHNLTSA